MRQTRDGEAVLFHDEDVVLGTQRIPVRSFTWRELERLSIPSEFGEYRIPRLEQVFHRYGRGTCATSSRSRAARACRHGTMARRVAKLASVFGVADRCLVASFDAEFLKRMREAAPAIATSFLFDHPVALPSPAQPTPLFPPVDAIGPKRDLVSPALLAQAAAANLSVHPWTVDDADEIRKLILAAASRPSRRTLRTRRCSIRSGRRRPRDGPRVLRPVVGRPDDADRGPARWSACSPGSWPGMFGIGGGLIIVPALVFFYGLTQHAAVGTSLGALLLPVGALSAWVYWKNGNLNVGYSALIAAGLFLGAYFGARLVQPVSDLTLRRLFAGVPDRRVDPHVLGESEALIFSRDRRTLVSPPP